MEDVESSIHQGMEKEVGVPLTEAISAGGCLALLQASTPPQQSAHLAEYLGI